MRIKHTYLFTMFVGLVWTGLLFGYMNGPDQNGAGVVDGVFAGQTCDQAGCHNSFKLNSGAGTLSVTGLPAQWTPGTTYPLTITVPKNPSSVIYGFQISAVFDSPSGPFQNAGTLTKGKTSGSDATRITVFQDPLTQIWVVEHNMFNNQLAPTQTFYVNWTAPASGGAVRFNVAGNSANGDQTPTGDYIYTFADVVAPAVSAPPDFSLSATSASVVAGNSTSVAVSVTPANGFNGSVTLAASGLPAGASGSFDSSTVAGSGTVNLSINVPSSVIPGTYPLTFTGTSGSLNHNAGASLTISAPLGNSSQTFSIVNLGGTSMTTQGAGSAIGVGYGEIQPSTGSTTPAGVAIFDFHENNTLASEVGVPATPTLVAGHTGRIYAEIGNGVDAGIAIANPNNSAATLSFYFTDANGNPAGSGTMPIAAKQQIAQFLDQPPLNVFPAGNFQGTFSFSSDQPVAVVALRGFTNERSDFLMSTLPVIDTASAPTTGANVAPEFADGGGWTTEVLLVNPTDNTMTGTVQFISNAGVPDPNITIGGQTNSSFTFSVPGRSSTKMTTSGAGGTTVGSIIVTPAGGGASPTPLVLFTYKPATITVSAAGVPITIGNAFRVYVESSGSSGQIGSIDSGIAAANTSSTQTVVTYTLTDLTGAPVSGIGPVAKTFGPNVQMQSFVSELFPALPASFKGVLHISTSASPISVVGLRARTNERGDFLITTTPPTNEAGSASNGPLYFPQIADGGGYTTQFILFSGIAGQTSSGTLLFFGQDGNPLFLSFQ